MKAFKIILILSLFVPVTGISQNKAVKDSVAKITEFEIPNSGAFTLLGTNPKNITTPGFTKDIKLDYFFNNFSLKPNIAFEFQPFWLFGFKNKSLEDYRQLTTFARFLGTTNFSAGTVQDNDSVNRLAYSIKFSFGHDPMMDTAYTNGIDRISKDILDKREKTELILSQNKFKAKRKLAEFNTRLDSLQEHNITDENILKPVKDSIEKYEGIVKAASAKLTLLTSDSSDIKMEFDKRLKTYVREYEEQNWHRFKMDIGAGKMNTYSDPSLLHAGFKNDGYGFWVNPSIGINPSRWFNKNADVSKSGKIIFTGLLKIIKTDSTDLKFYGANIKYGTSRLNLFGEYTYQKDSVVTQCIAYGGAYQIGNDKLIEFGIRTNYDSKLKFKNLMPVVSLKWKFVNDLFNKQ